MGHSCHQGPLWSCTPGSSLLVPALIGEDEEEGLGALSPVHGVAGVLLQVRGLLVDEPVGGAGRAAPPSRGHGHAAR